MTVNIKNLWSSSIAIILFVHIMSYTFLLDHNKLSIFMEIIKFILSFLLLISLNQTTIISNVFGSGGCCNTSLISQLIIKSNFFDR